MGRTGAYALSFLLFSGFSMGASTAQAGLGLLTAGDTGGLYCMPLEACNPDVCPGDACACQAPLACEPLDGTGEFACAASDSLQLDTICWSPDGTGGEPTCPVRGGVEPHCVRPGDIASDTFCVCVYPEKLDYCVGVVEGDGLTNEQTATLRGCLTNQEGYLTWTGGDCDGDGIGNARDCCPCSEDLCCTNSASCDPAVMTPSCAPDAGVPDAGPEPVEDAGVEPEPMEDAGSEPEPEPMHDAGHEEGDGAPVAAGATFNGEGGCSVSHAPVSGSAAWALLALCLVGLGRRRRP